MIAKFDIKEFRFNRHPQGTDIAELIKDNELHAYDLYEFKTDYNANTGMQFMTSNYTYVLRFRKQML